MSENMKQIFDAVRKLAWQVYGVHISDSTARQIATLYAYFYSKGLSDWQAVDVATWFYARQLPGYNGKQPKIDPASDVGIMLAHVIEEGISDE